MDLTGNDEKLRIIGSGAIEEEQVAARLIEWQKQQTGMMYVKVMTDEQMELLRKQISIYATICERLVEMHKAITSQQDFAGMRLGNVYCDTLTTSTGHKISTRQRWTPTPMQLQVLEQIFEQGTGTPSKQKIKDITNQLTQHGPISETNVYNWFQNRRARSKRKQNGAGAGNSAESEVETEIESPRVKRAKSENEVLFQNSERSSELDPQSGKGDDGCDVSYYDTVILSNSNPRIDHLMGKMEVPGSFYGYRQGDGYE